MLVDVSDVFHQYRLALRDVWNRNFWSDPELRDWNSADYFETVKPLLFRGLVLEKLGQAGTCPHVEQPSDIAPFFVVPNAKSATVTVLKKSSWHRELRLTSAEITLRFRDFFDWGALRYRDLRYYLVSIVACPPHPDVVGLDALVDVYQGDVF